MISRRLLAYSSAACRRRHQLRAFLAGVVEPAPRLATLVGCWSKAQSGISGLLLQRPPRDFGELHIMRSRWGCGVASVVPVATATCSGLLVPRGPAILSPWHEVTRDHLRRIDPGSGRASDGTPQGSRPAPVEAWNKRMLRRHAGRRDQYRVWLSRNEVPCLQVALDIVRRPNSTPVDELERYMR